MEWLVEPVLMQNDGDHTSDEPSTRNPKGWRALDVAVGAAGAHLWCNR